MSSRNGERANAGAARVAAVASAISLNTMLAESEEIRVLSAAYLVLGLAARSLEITRGAAGRGREGGGKLLGVGPCDVRVTGTTG